jgi:hypothetical protein
MRTPNLQFYHGYCKDQRKTAFIILQQTNGYCKIDAHRYIQREYSVELICENKQMCL